MGPANPDTLALLLVRGSSVNLGPSGPQKGPHRKLHPELPGAVGSRRPTPNSQDPLLHEALWNERVRKTCSKRAQTGVLQHCTAAAAATF